MISYPKNAAISLEMVLWDVRMAERKACVLGYSKQVEERMAARRRIATLNTQRP
jgi:hypothetical protein